MAPKNLISFLEKPITKSEQEIAAIAGDFLKTIAAGNVSFLASFISDDAIIEIKNGEEEASKSRFIEHISELAHRLRYISYEEAFIRISDEKNLFPEAIFSCVQAIFFNDAILPLRRKRYIKFCKNGRWLIKEARFVRY